MRTLLAIVIFFWSFSAQSQNIPSPKQRALIIELIDKYSRAREQRDTVLLKSILTVDIDQLVSTGEWREGVAPAIKGMQRSSANNPGTRRLVVDKIRLISASSAIVDSKYEIKNDDGSIRTMWSTFIVVIEKNNLWKIAAIRNMLPAPQ